MNLILYDDYNLLHVRFTSNNIGLKCRGRSSECLELINVCFSSLNLYKLNNVLNNREIQLDLVFSNNSLINGMPLVNSIVPIDLYRPVLVSEYILIDSTKNICSNNSYYNFIKQIITN